MTQINNKSLPTQSNGSVLETSPLDVYDCLNTFKIIDVRTAEEFTGELGHIQGATLKTLGPDLINYLNTLNKSEQIIFVCKSGGRSGQATQYAASLGFTKPVNMTGGMTLWNMHKLPIER